jgi:hypothetical protein
LAVNHPNLAAELHPERNGDLDPYALGAGSNRMVWWRCKAGHEWSAKVSHRTRGTGCPVCRATAVKYSAEQVIAALREDAETHGRSPRVKDWRGRPIGMPGVAAVYGRFGSWNGGLRAAGLEVTHGR